MLWIKILAFRLILQPLLFLLVYVFESNEVDQFGELSLVH